MNKTIDSILKYFRLRESSPESAVVQMKQRLQPDENLRLWVNPIPGPGNGRHFYAVYGVGDNKLLANIQFQNGPIFEHGVNGITNEILLEIVADRLRDFQRGPYPCPENESALQNVNAALDHLYTRTRNRQLRGVEGLSKP